METPEEAPGPLDPAQATAAWAALPEDYRLRFGGIARLYGTAASLKFYHGTATIIGLGGVGSWVVEALARSGVNHLRMIDLDDICITNVNRQLPALDGDIGRPKIEVLAARVLKINPAAQLELHHAFVTPANFPTYLAPATCGVVVDCIDRASVKADLVAYSRINSIPFILVGGAGGRVDPTAVRVDDLTRTEGDPLLKQVRKQLKRRHQLPRFPGKKLGVPCVFSNEPLRFPTADGSCSTEPEPDTSLRLDCSSGYGAATHLTGAFGFAAAAQVLEMLSK